MTSFATSERMPKGLIVREGIDTDYLTVNGQTVVAGGPTGPTGPTGAGGATGATGPTGPTGPAVSGAVLYAATGAIPTSDPHIVGHIWSNSGTITISAG